jgi:DNA polymerase III delta subunit
MPHLSREKLLERLAQGKPIPAVVLQGTDAYLRDMCRTRIVETSVPAGARDWAVARLSAREAGWDEILGRARTVPMLSPRQVIVVEDAESVEKLGEDARDEIVDMLAEYFGSPAPFTLLLLEAAALDGRLKFSKLLQEKALVVELKVGPESAAALAEQMAKDLGAEIDRPAAALLAEILNGEPGRMHIEIEKLATYAGDAAHRARITARDVEALVVAARRNTVWQLADMLATRQREPALTTLDNLLREGEPLIAIVGALAWRYRTLIAARELGPHTPGYQAARQLGTSPVAAENAIRQAHPIPKQDLLAGIAALAEADSQLKSANPNPRAMMEFLIARLTSSGASHSPRAA